MRLSKNILCSFAIIMLNIVYFIWQPYSKHIIYSPATGINASDIITNVIYFVIYFVVIIIISNFTFCDNIFTRLRGLKAILTVCILFSLQLLFDGVKALSQAYLSDYYYVVNDLCAVIGFVFQFSLIIKLLGSKQTEKDKKHISTVLFSLAIIVFLIFEFKNFIDIGFIKNANLKYDSNSEYYSNMVRNYAFSHEFRSLLVKTICGVLIFGGIFRKYAMYEIIKGDKEEITKPISRVISAVLAIDLLIVPILGLFSIKCAILPKSSFGNFTLKNSTMGHVKENELYIDNGGSTIWRSDSNGETYIVFDETKRIFMFNSTVMYKLPIATSHDFFKEAPDELTQLIDYNDSGVEFKTYANDLLIIKKGYYYEFVSLKKLKQMPYDKSIVICLEHMISNGVFSYFEYGYEYLIKHDPDFIKPYITRYKAGVFTLSELSNPYNTYINSDYIKNLLKL